MNKIITIFLLLLFLTGCGSNSKLYKEKDIYQQMISDLKLIKEKDSSTNLPCDINIYFDKIITSELSYQVVIDNPKETLKDISVVVIHNYKTDNIYPSIGIFDDKVNLIPNTINIEKNNVKGINLVGYIDYKKDITQFHGIFKVMIKYKDEINKTRKVYFMYQN